MEWEIVEDYAVFPPLHHEGLQIVSQPVVLVQDDERPPELPLPPSSSSSSSLSSLAEEEKDEPEMDSASAASSRSKKLLMKCFGPCLVVFRRWVVWPAAGSAIGIAAVLVLLYVTVRRWRRQRLLITTGRDSTNQLLLLVKEKDERINQLLLQVAEMKSLSSRRRVPVHRIISA